jgi:REP element-mobilizing transposase RayT
MSEDQMTRGNLPHWYRPGYAHFITYRLIDTIPSQQLRKWREVREQQVRRRPPSGVSVLEHHMRAHKQFFAEYDRYLGESTSRRWLADERVAAVIRENLSHHHGTKYELLAWCVMPNHVHVLLQPFDSSLIAKADAGSVGHESECPYSDEVLDGTSPLSGIMHSLKSFTANRANEILNRTGAFWQKESYDHWVRDLDELERIVTYIAANPVSAGLCDRPREWPFSSAYDRYALDGSECGMVGRLRDDWRCS